MAALHIFGSVFCYEDSGLLGTGMRNLIRRLIVYMSECYLQNNFTEIVHVIM